mgnify:CR=1 FL=1
MDNTNILPSDQNFVRAAGFESSSTAGLVMAGQIDEITGRILVDSASASGVTSLNTLTGAVVLAAGTNITLTPVGNTITIDAAGGASGITIGTTTITSGTNTRILYNNAGVVGEYTLSGSGTVVAMQTAPTFVTSITTPSVLATANDSGALGASGTAFSDLFLASGGVINWNAGASTLTHSLNTLTLGGSGVTTFALGTNSLTMTGSLAATGARVTKGWFTDVESTNMVTIGGTSLTTVAQTFQNKTITNSNNVLGGVTMTLGSDADGDTYYRASNVLTRVAKGTAGQVYTMNAGATAPEWAAAGGGTSALTLIPFPVTPLDIAGTVATSSTNNVNTTAKVGQIVITAPITINKISFKTGAVAVAGTLSIALFSEDGQTQKFSVTTASISSANTIITTAVSSVVLTPGIYYIYINPNSTADVNTYFYTTSNGQPFTTGSGLADSVTSEPVTQGTYTITASTVPATLTIANISWAQTRTLCFRLDN